MKRISLVLTLATLLLWLTACIGGRNTGNNTTPSNPSATTAPTISYTTPKTESTVESAETTAADSGADSATRVAASTAKKQTSNGQTPLSDEEEKEFKDQVSRLIDSLLEGE